MVRLMQEELFAHDEYVAGLRRRSLHLHMLWEVGFLHAKSRPVHYYAPSWSWASVEGEVRCDFISYTRDYNALATVVAVEMEYITDDAFGQVKSGLIRVRAPLMKRELRVDPESMHPNGVTGRQEGRTRPFFRYLTLYE